MGLQSLPPELLLDITLQSDTCTLKTLRLTSKTLSFPSTKTLFSHLTILSSDVSAQKAKSVLSDDTLTAMVNTVEFHTQENTGKAVLWGCSPEEKNDRTLPGSWYHVLARTGLFPNLRRVELKFCPYGAAGRYDARRHVTVYDRLDREYSEPRESRDNVLKCLFAGLNHVEHPATKVEALCIKNLLNVSEETLMKSKDFDSALKRLSTLELCMTTDIHFNASEYTWRLPLLHEFYRGPLQDIWLKPVAHKLTKLKLYSSLIQWGYLPKCDLRGIFFPTLKELHLGQWVISHDWQIEWICSHGLTLEKLTFCECSVLFFATKIREWDEEEYVNFPMSAREIVPGHSGYRVFNTRWHHIFTSMIENLPKLKGFGFGATSKESKFPLYTNEALQIEMAESLIKANEVDLSRARYQFCYFADDPNTEEDIDVLEEAEEEFPELKRPDCDAEDRAALNELLRVIRLRD